MKITFLGAAGQVTGSKYLVQDEGLNFLVDSGLFQGIGSDEKNHEPLSIDAASIQAVILTHAHIDHSGYIPALYKQGFKGKVYCTKGTYELCQILLPDCASILEEEAENKSTDIKVLPLYTKIDALHALKFFQTVDYDVVVNISETLQVTFHPAGHIVGASFVVLSNGKQTLSFSGDLGRFNQLIMKAPQALEKTDYLVMESTYGDRLHATNDPIQQLGQVIGETFARRGVLVIPAFAVGRIQMVLYCLYQLKQKNLLPNIPIFLDSPTGIQASNLLCRFTQQTNLSDQECRALLGVAKFMNTVQQSKTINHMKNPMIIISASGMAQGGRIMHHLKHFVTDKKNTILFVGYQAEGTEGYDLVHGAKEIEIEDQIYPVKAHIKMIDSFSAHSDYNEILHWLSFIKDKPKKIFITHGQPDSALSLQEKIQKRFGWEVVVPKHLDSFDLD